jgi:type VI secretion system secreted protein Hcp
MASPAYMTILDEKGQKIKGSVKIKGREECIEIYGFNHEVRIPTDNDTGALTATRKHGNFSIIKEYCAATPVLNKACTSGQTLKELNLAWYRIDEDGKEQEYFRHTLYDVKVVNVKSIIDDVKDKTKEHIGHREEVSFRYRKIKWTYLDGNIETSDEWASRAA